MQSITTLANMGTYRSIDGQGAKTIAKTLILFTLLSAIVFYSAVFFANLHEAKLTIYGLLTIFTYMITMVVAARAKGTAYKTPTV
jgi:hypothetical protein